MSVDQNLNDLDRKIIWETPLIKEEEELSEHTEGGQQLAGDTGGRHTSG